MQCAESQDMGKDSFAESTSDWLVSNESESESETEAEEPPVSHKIV